ncbi:MAG: HEAT repeat domain-containing protein [Myxococcota bacterium]
MERLHLERSLLAIAGLLLVLLLLESVWLLLRMAWLRWRRGLESRLQAEIPSILFDPFDAVVEQYSSKMTGLRGLVLRDHLTTLCARLRGDQLQRIQSLYLALGFLARDRAALSERAQPEVARRLVTVAPRELAIQPLAIDRLSQAVRLMMVMGIGSSTPTSRIIELLTSLEDLDEFQVHPVDIAIGRLSQPQLQALMKLRSSFRCPSVEALILQESCLKVPGQRRVWLDGAFGSDRPALRRTACDVARLSLRIDDAHELMLAAYDPVPEVRAAALAALGALRDPEAESVLVDALQDGEHRVRIASARAMEQLGSAGVERLWQMRDGHPDPRIRRVAGTVLDRVG